MQEGNLPGTVGEQLDRFLDDLLIAGRSPATLKVYGWKLRAILPLDAPLHELTSAALRSLVAEAVRTLAPNSAVNVYTMLCSFSRWMFRQGVTPVNLMAGIPSPRRPEPQTKALGPEALARLWQAACELDAMMPVSLTEADIMSAGIVAGNRTEPNGVAPARSAVSACAMNYRHPDSTTYRLLFAMLRDTGMRRAEVAGARYDDIEGDVLRVLGKRRRYRRVLLSGEVLGLLRGAGGEGSNLAIAGLEGQCYAAQLPHPRAPQITTRGPIFGVSPSRIGQLFAQIARRAGVKCSAHALRHTWATEFLRQGGQMEAARILGGWSDMRQLSQRYGKSAIEDAALMEARRLAARPDA